MYFKSPHLVNRRSEGPLTSNGQHGHMKTSSAATGWVPTFVGRDGQLAGGIGRGTGVGGSHKSVSFDGIER